MMYKKSMVLQKQREGDHHFLAQSSAFESMNIQWVTQISTVKSRACFAHAIFFWQAGSSLQAPVQRVEVSSAVRFFVVKGGNPDSKSSCCHKQSQTYWHWRIRKHHCRVCQGLVIQRNCQWPFSARISKRPLRSSIQWIWFPLKIGYPQIPKVCQHEMANQVNHPLVHHHFPLFLSQNGHNWSHWIGSREILEDTPPWFLSRIFPSTYGLGWN